MQAIAIRSELSAALNLACKVTEKRCIGVPILNNLAFVERAGILTALATDLDRSLTISLPGSPADPGFAVTIPAHAFRDAEKKAPVFGEVELIATNEDGPNRVRARFGRLNLSMQSLPFGDFPLLEMSAPIYSDFTVSRADLLTALDAVQFAISTGGTRYYLNGIYIHREGDKLRFVATDGHLLAVHEIDAPEGCQGMPGVIFPSASVAILHDLVKAKVGDSFRFEVNTAKVRVTVGNVVLLTKLIDGTFPDYGRVIPVRNDKALTLSVADAIEAVKAVSVIASERRRTLKATLSKGSVTFSVNNPDAGTASQEIPATWDSEEMKIGWNIRYLLDILERIEGDSVTIMLSEPGSPCLVRDGANSFVLMPVQERIT